MQPIIENTVNTPAFLGKLWKMVNDPSTDHLICWSAAGNSFVIQNQAQFWYELLPLYYKHNNMSSFVRQLNMYGFHKMSTVENGTMDADKDEIQFTHPYFQKDQPELLRNIKRKATTSKTAVENAHKHDELTKVLTDVKQLRGRQASVDSQLNAMKQENALLWREVAILRQKHLKQQKIVNKLIQFLVTLVQPSRMTVGVKRGYQLMLNESPNKRTKNDNSNKNNQLNNSNNNNNNNNHHAEGPTIHEVDSELDLTPNIYEEEPPLEEPCPVEGNNETINSPATSTTSQHTDLNSPLPSVLLVDGNGDQSDSWDKPDFVTISDLSDENLISTLENEVTPTLTTTSPATSNDKVFLNPSTQDTLLSNLGKRNDVPKNGKKTQIDTNNVQIKIEQLPSNTNMAIATRDNCFSDVIKSMPSTSDSYSEDLSQHVESTQNELDQLKEILNGYNNIVDANALLGDFNKTPQKLSSENLFTDSPEYIPIAADNESDTLMGSVDPIISEGSELAPYGQNFDFDELLYDDDIDQQNVSSTPSTTTTTTTVPSSQLLATTTEPSSTINTPQIKNEEPIFPIASSKD